MTMLAYHGDHSRCARTVASLLEVTGEVEVPWEVVEQVDGHEVVTWERISGTGRVVQVWTTRSRPEIQAQDEAAYTAWLADLRREAVDEATTAAMTVGDLRAQVLKPLYFKGFVEGINEVRRRAGLPELEAPQPVEEDVPWPLDEQTPASWFVP